METSSLSSARESEAFKEAPSGGIESRELEAARYALLQRLAPGIRHQISGAFQPVMMLASVMQRLAQAPDADPAKMAAHCASMHGLSHAGVTCSLESFSWFAPVERVDIGVNDGVGECVSLVATELALREFTIVNDLTICTETWPRDALRNVFMAALLAITDVAPSPAELVLSSEATIKGLALTLKVRGAKDAVVHEAVPIYRKIEWSDVALLADAEGVSLERIAGGVRLSLFRTVSNRGV